MCSSDLEHGTVRAGIPAPGRHSLGERLCPRTSETRDQAQAGTASVAGPHTPSNARGAKPGPKQRSALVRLKATLRSRHLGTGRVTQIRSGGGNVTLGAFDRVQAQVTAAPPWYRQHPLGIGLLSRRQVSNAQSLTPNA